MAARPSWAQDESRHREWADRGARPAVRNQMLHWLMAPLIHCLPNQATLDTANAGDSSNNASFTCCSVYVRIHEHTNKLWFLEYQSVNSKRGGINKTLKWFDEVAGCARWSSHWLPLRNSGDTTTLGTQPLHITRSDGTLDIERIKEEYLKLDVTAYTYFEGAPTLAQLNDQQQPLGYI